MAGMEMFQVVGGAMACVDLAMKAYKEIERFRLRVKQADEVGIEMASKFGRLTKTLDDVHSALKCRKDQLNGQAPSEGETRVWENIRDSLKGVRKAMRTFKAELEKLDGGRDISKERKWIDRAIWELKRNKRTPIFDRLEEAANSRVEELTLSLFSMQIFMHTETNQWMHLLVERVEGIETTLRKVSTTRQTRAVGAARARKSHKEQLQACLEAAYAIVDKRGGKAASPTERRDSRMTAMLPDDDGKSVWEDTDAESVFSKVSSSRRGTVQIAPDELPATGLGISSSSRPTRSPLLDDFSDTSEDDFNDLSDDSDHDDDNSMMTDMTNMDDVSDSHERFQTAQNSMSTTITSEPRANRTDSITSTYSNASCTGIDQRRVDPLIQAMKAKDAKTVQYVLSADAEIDPARRVSITVCKIPILHMAVRQEAGADVIDALFKSARVDINAVEPEERKTALHWAVKYNRQSCCARLLQAPDVNIEKQDKYDFTPLDSALHLSSHSDADVYTVVKLLLEAGAKITTPLPRGLSNTVETLVKKYGKRRRESGGSSTMGSPDLVRAQTASSERKSHDDGGSFRRRLTLSLGRSVSAKN